MKRWYDAEEDILNVQIARKSYWKSVEMDNGIVLDVAEDGSIIALEIPNASKVFCGDVEKVISQAEVAA